MIDKQKVIELTNEWLAEKEYFLVDITVSKDDKITVEIDHADGVWIEDCADLSRHIEAGLSRETEDYELEVGSAGLGQPFKVLQQYINHIGKEIEILGKDGKKHKGVLKSADEQQFILTVTTKEKLEGAKRPQLVEKELPFAYNDIKYAKYLIVFK